MKLRSNIAGFLIGSIILAPAIHAGINLSSSGGITAGSTPISGGVANGILYGNAAGVVSSNASYTITDAGAGDGAFAFRKTSAANTGFLTVSGSLPIGASLNPYGVRLSITGGSINSTQYGSEASLTPVTANGGNNGEDIAFQGLYYPGNGAGSIPAGGGTGIVGIAGVVSISNKRLTGVRGIADSVSGTGSIITGVEGVASAGGVPGRAWGVVGRINTFGGPATNYAAGLFVLSGAAATVTTYTGTAALIADNTTYAANIFEARDNGSAVFTIPDGGGFTWAGATATATCTVSTCKLIIGSSGLLDVNNAIPGGVSNVFSVAQTNTLAYFYAMGANTTAAGSSNGFGLATQYRLESSTTNTQDVGATAFRWIDSTHATRTSEFLIQTVNNGAAEVDTLTVGPGHLGVSGTAPAITSCQTSPTITGSDGAGKFTAGTGGAATACVLTFARPYVAAPACIVTNETTSQLMQAVTTTTTLTVNGVDYNGDVVSYVCLGR